MRGHVDVRLAAVTILVSAGILLAAPGEARQGRWSVIETEGEGGASGGGPSGGPSGEPPSRARVTFDLFVPRAAALEASAGVGRGAPAIVFLHEAGRPPETYRGVLTDTAEALGVVLVLPHATTPLGWGFDGDFQAIEASLARADQLIPIDPSKVAIAGHGEGAGYAYLLAYLTELRVSAVLTLGAPFLPVSDLFDPERAPPVRMVFGEEDPYARSDAEALGEQWSALGVEWELEVVPGFGHSNWPERTIFEALRFLVERAAAQDGRCSTSRTALCLGGGRFRVEVTFASPTGRPGRGRVVEGGTDDSGIFWFFDSENWEVMVKVLDGCAVNDRYWVFAAAPTDLDFRVTVTEQVTGEVAQYRHQPGLPASAVTDTDAFAGCGSP